jgi:chitinase
LIVGHALLLRSFWALNRDRACPSGQSAGETCSGIPQNTYDFTRALATYSG